YLAIFCRQRAFAFGEQRPRLFVSFIFVAVFFEREHGVEHESGFARGAEDYGGGDEIPDILRNYVGGEEVYLLESVVLLFEEVRFELAEVSGAGADGGGLDLDAENVWAVGDADIVGGGVA